TRDLKKVQWHDNRYRNAIEEVVQDGDGWSVRSPHEATFVSTVFELWEDVIETATYKIEESISPIRKSEEDIIRQLSFGELSAHAVRVSDAAPIAIPASEWPRLAIHEDEWEVYLSFKHTP